MIVTSLGSDITKHVLLPHFHRTSKDMVKLTGNIRYSNKPYNRLKLVENKAIFTMFKMEIFSENSNYRHVEGIRKKKTRKKEETFSVGHIRTVDSSLFANL